MPCHWVSDSRQAAGGVGTHRCAAGGYQAAKIKTFMGVDSGVYVMELQG